MKLSGAVIPFAFAADGEALQAHAIEANVDLVRLAHADHVVVLLAPQQRP